VGEPEWDDGRTDNLSAILNSLSGDMLELQNACVAMNADRIFESASRLELLCDRIRGIEWPDRAATSIDSSSLSGVAELCNHARRLNRIQSELLRHSQRSVRIQLNLMHFSREYEQPVVTIRVATVLPV
jgi:hypothetical protein